MSDNTPESLLKRIERACATAVFIDVFGNRFDSSVVKKLYRTNQRCSITSTDRICIPSSELRALVSEVADPLGPYTSKASGSVGNGLYFQKGSHASPRLPNVEDYAKILVIAASRIGPERVANLLLSWVQGRPVRLRRCTLIKGIKTVGEIRPIDGIHLDTLPRNHSDFPRSLRIDRYDIHAEQFAGRAMLCIDYDTDAALYNPDKFAESSRSVPRRDLVNPELASLSPESFCRSMSLIADNHVDWFMQWEDYGDLEAFFLGSVFGSGRNETTNPSPVIVSEEDVRACLDIHDDLAAYPKLDLAITRWRRSKSSISPHEQLVELRIALESVLLGDDRGNVGEKRHRLAIRGAWFLGATYTERSKHFRSLKTLYDYASSVVHAGNPKEKPSAPLDDTISEVQGLCRQAILRIAKARAMPDWMAIVLAREPAGLTGSTESRYLREPPRP